MNKVHDVVGPHLPGLINIAPVAAATATLDVGIWRVPYKALCTGIGINVSAAVTGDNTNTKQINVKRSVNGGVAAEVAHLDLATGTDLDLGYNEIPFNTGTTLALAEGDFIIVEFEKTGNGVAIGASTVEVSIEGA